MYSVYVIVNEYTHESLEISKTKYYFCKMCKEY